jgi:hypothetical protein
MLLKDGLAYAWSMQTLPSKNKKLRDEGYVRTELMCLCTYGKIDISLPDTW